MVVGVGSRPATGWLVDSGLELDNGVVCDEHLRTSVTNVYAAGDVASWHNPLFERRMRIEHFMAAAEQGARAARNAVTPGLSQPYVTVPYFWSDWYGSRIQFVGVTTEDYEVVSGSLGEEHFVVLFRSGNGVVGGAHVERAASHHEVPPNDRTEEELRGSTRLCRVAQGRGRVRLAATRQISTISEEPSMTSTVDTPPPTLVTDIPPLDVTLDELENDPYPIYQRLQAESPGRVCP